MNKAILFWLQKEIPKWQEKGWITPEVADHMRAHYGSMDKKTNHTLIRGCIVALGGILILLGIYIIIDGYLKDIPPEMRYNGINILLLISLGISGVALIFGRRLLALREWAGLIFYLCITAGTYGVANIYYLDTDPSYYLILTSVLTLAMSYVLHSSVGLGCTLLTAAFWCSTPAASNLPFIGSLGVWGIIFASIPFFFLKLWKQNGWTGSRIFLSWTSVLALYIAFFNTLAPNNGALDAVLLTNLATITASLSWLGNERNIWSKPFRFIGFFAILVSIFLGSSTNGWVYFQNIHDVSWLTAILAALTLGITVYYSYQLIKEKKFVPAFISLLGLVYAGCGLIAYSGMNAFTTSIIFSIYILVGSTALAIRATMKKSLLMLNMSALLIIAMVASHLVDSEYTFIERGILIVIVGFILLVANLLYIARSHQRRRSFNKKVKKSKEKIKAKEEENTIDVTPVTPKIETSTNDLNDFTNSLEIKEGENNEK